MADFVPGKSVVVGHTTKKSDYDPVAENTDWLYGVLKAVEEELGFDGLEADYYAEYGYSGGDLSTVDIYTDSGKGTKLWDIDFSYSGGDLTQVTVVRVSDSTTLTYAYGYTGDDLTSVTKTIS